MNHQAVCQLLITLAPIIMGALGKQHRQQYAGGNLGNLIQILGGAQQQQQQSNNPFMQILGRVLDQDGDGSMQDDAMNMGAKILGNLFKK